MTTLITSESTYREWLTELSKRYRSSQIRAAVKVNEELLRFYWQLGTISLNVCRRINGALLSTPD